MRIALRDSLPSLTLSTLGLLALAGLTLAPRPDAPALGLLVAPWAPEAAGLAAVAALDAAIMDIRAGGRRIVISPPAAGSSFRNSLPGGVFLIGAGGGSCLSVSRGFGGGAGA